MGREKYQTKVKELFDKSQVVSFNSINRIVNDKKNKKQYTKKLVRNLILNKKIISLAKGCYTSKQDPSLIVFCLRPAYLGLQDALSRNNLWGQETIPVVLTSRKVRCGIRKVNNLNVLVRRIDKKYIFGINYDEQPLPYSDIEKTFIDMVYFNEKIDKEVLEEIKDKIDIKKLSNYLKKYPKKIKNKVLNKLV